MVAPCRAATLKQGTGRNAAFWGCQVLSARRGNRRGGVGMKTLDQECAEKILDVIPFVLRGIEREIPQSGVTRRELAILAYLKQYGRAHPTDVALCLGMSKAAVSTTIDRMTEQKLIVWSTGRETDRRSVRLILTPQGRRAARPLLTHLPAVRETNCARAGRGWDQHHLHFDAARGCGECQASTHALCEIPLWRTSGTRARGRDPARRDWRSDGGVGVRQRTADDCGFAADVEAVV
jgi:DNA-binding MarR family transcriptional regulator